MRRTRARRLTALLAFLALVAVALGACGGTARQATPAEILRAGDLPLAARFAVVDGALGAPLAGAPDAVAEGRALWSAVARLAPTDVRRTLSGFAVYAPTDATNAFTRLDERGDGWIVGVAPAPPGRRLDAVILHELAHVVTLGPGEVDASASSCATYATIFGCARDGSCIARFVRAFWDPAAGGADPAASTADRLRAGRGAFLGPYAASLPEEDVVITWVARATRHPLTGEVLRAKSAFLGSCPALAALERSLPGAASAGSAR